MGGIVYARRLKRLAIAASALGVIMSLHASFDASVAHGALEKATGETLPIPFGVLGYFLVAILFLVLMIAAIATPSKER